MHGGCIPAGKLHLSKRTVSYLEHNGLVVNHFSGARLKRKARSYEAAWLVSSVGQRAPSIWYKEALLMKGPNCQTEPPGWPCRFMIVRWGDGSSCLPGKLCLGSLLGSQSPPLHCILRIQRYGALLFPLPSPLLSSTLSSGALASTLLPGSPVIPVP